MKTQMHATLDEAPLRVEAVKIERSEGGAFISLSIRQAGDSIVDGINILMRDSSALRVLVTDLDAACAAIEEEEDPDFDGWRCSGMEYHLPECGGGCGSLTRPGMDEEGPVGAVPATGGE